jgi:hypothetical protein
MSDVVTTVSFLSTSTPLENILVPLPPPTMPLESENYHGQNSSHGSISDDEDRDCAKHHLTDSAEDRDGDSSDHEDKDDDGDGISSKSEDEHRGSVVIEANDSKRSFGNGKASLRHKGSFRSVRI